MDSLDAFRSSADRSISAAVTQALASLGGSAHLTEIITRVAANAAHQTRSNEELECSVLSILVSREAESAESHDTRKTFYRPFGPESRRWSLVRHITGSAIQFPLARRQRARG